MAVTGTSSSDERASSGAGMLSRRRMWVGTNVLVTVGLAFVVVCLVNWFGQRYFYRRDLSRLGAYRLSDRTRRVLDHVTDDVRLTAIYTSDEPDKARKKYLPRIQDLFAEMSLQNPRVRTEIVRTDEQKRRVEKRIRDTFAAQADEHIQALDEAKALDDELTTTLQNQATLLGQIRDSGAWISRFSSFTNIVENLDGMVKLLSTAREDVRVLVEGESLPNYTEAKGKIKNAHNQVKDVLEESRRWLEEMGRVLTDVRDGKTPTVAELPERLDEMGRLVETLGRSVGAPGDEMPEDLTGALKDFGQAAGELSTYLAGEIARLQDFSDEYPVIVEHPRWSVQFSLLGGLAARMDLPAMLRQEQQKLAGLRPQIVALLKRDLEPNQVRVALERVRNLTHDMQLSLKAVADELRQLPDDLARVDEATWGLLSGDNMSDALSDMITRLTALDQRFDELPELELGTMGHTLKRENTVVVDAADQVTVLSFDDVWPIEYQDFSIPGRVTEPRRAFNGDSAISAALLSMTEEKPVAAVILTTFEPQIPQEVRRFVRPPSNAWPALHFDNLRKKLAAAHFTVQTWNVATDSAPPELEEGIDPVYLVLPPIQYLVPPFVRQQGMEVPELDEAKKQLVQDAIGRDGRAIFVAGYSPPQSAMMGMFGTGPVSQPKYPYDDYLRKTWGIDLQTQYRTMLGIPDPRRPGYWGVSGETFAYMSLNNFSTHPIGDPFRHRRMPMYNVCPVAHAEEVPEGIALHDVLTVPASDDYWGCQNIEDVVRAVLTPQSSGWVQKDFDPTDGFMDIRSPFPVMVAAENDDGGRVVVSGHAESVWDGYLNQPIPHSNPKGRISFEPPPVANAELVVNAAYWVCGREELIGAGPVVTPVIGTLEAGVKTTMSLAVTGWAFLTLVVGAVVMFVRRK